MGNYFKPQNKIWSHKDQSVTLEAVIMVKINACKVVITLLISISILRDGTGITCLHLRLMNSEITFKVLTFQTCSVLKRCKIIRFQKRKCFSLAAKRELD